MQGFEPLNLKSTDVKRLKRLDGNVKSLVKNFGQLSLFGRTSRSGIEIVRGIVVVPKFKINSHWSQSAERRMEIQTIIAFVYNSNLRWTC